MSSTTSSSSSPFADSRFTRASLGAALALLGALGAAGADEPLKGYELYSWRPSAQLEFSLVAGTNRDKSADEIRAAPLTLGQVLTLIGELPRGSSVAWLPCEPALGSDRRCGPTEIERDRLFKAALKRGVRITLVSEPRRKP